MQTPTEDDGEHGGGDGRAHMGVAQLQLEAEEGAIEKGAEDVGREVRSRQRTLGHVDQVEGVEIADEGEDRDDPDGGQDERQLDLPELRPAGEAVHFRRLDHVVGDGEEGGVDQHHGDAHELPDGDEGEGGQGVFLFAQPGGEENLSPTASSIPGAMPQMGDRISFQTNPTMTKDRMVGMKMAVR